MTRRTSAPTTGNGISSGVSLDLRAPALSDWLKGQVCGVDFTPAFQRDSVQVVASGLESGESLRLPLAGPFEIQIHHRRQELRKHAADGRNRRPSGRPRFAAAASPSMGAVGCQAAALKLFDEVQARSAAVCCARWPSAVRSIRKTPRRWPAGTRGRLLTRRQRARRRGRPPGPGTAVAHLRSTGLRAGALA